MGLTTLIEINNDHISDMTTDKDKIKFANLIINWTLNGKSYGESSPAIIDIHSPIHRTDYTQFIFDGRLKNINNISIIEIDNAISNLNLQKEYVRTFAEQYSKII